MFDSLPVSVRVADRLSEILIVGNALRIDLETEEAAPLRWVIAEIDRVLAKTGDVLNRLVS
jgi:hypothetical protein